MELTTDPRRGAQKAASASTLRRVAPALAIALASTCLVVGCTSASKGATTKPAAVASTSTSKLDKATTCTQMAAAQVKFGRVLTAVSNNDMSAVELVTKLDPIRASFEKLAKTTSDATMAGLMSSEAKMINKIETGDTSSSAIESELSIDISSLKSACNSKATTLHTVPQNLQIPGETTTVAAP